MSHYGVLKLDGIWDFAFCEDDSKVPGIFPAKAAVPGCFDTTPELWSRRGVGYYRKPLELSRDRRYRLIIEGVAHNAKVYLDGNLLREHHGAFTPIEVDLPPGLDGMHELVISADNRFAGLDRPLHMTHFDWYSYGGIIRPVSLISWKDALITNIFADTRQWKSGDVVLNLDYLSSDEVKELPLKLLLDGDEIHGSQVPSQAARCQVTFTIPKPKPWSPEEPNLYRLGIELGDDFREVNLGLREIRTDGSQILLNDKPISIRGVNRHESHVEFGFALPHQSHINDIQLMKKLNCNFVRISHYPPSKAFLDLCDQLGMLVWVEATSWGYDEKATADPRMLQAQRNCITEMIGWNSHHPCIACWGFFNECASESPAARPIYEELVGLIRRLDPTRPVTFASNRIYCEEQNSPATIQDIMFDLVDWISINIYPGWYSGELDNCAEKLAGLAKEFKSRKLDNKPVIISEIGAGGIVGFEHYTPIRWSLEYQCELLENTMEYIRTEPLFNGVCVWQFCDIRTSEYRWADRPRNYNNKGILDEYRRPKPAFRKVQEIFRREW